jgi:hypothetical protein
MSNYVVPVHNNGGSVFEVEAGGAIQLDAGAAVSDANAVGRVYIGEKTLTNALTNLFDVAMPAGAMFGAVLEWAIQATDGTDMQAFSGVTTFASVNKAAAFTDVVTTLAGIQAKAVSTGTLTATFSVVDGTNKITLALTPATSLTATTYRISYKLTNHSRQTVTVL